MTIDLVIFLPGAHTPQSSPRIPLNPLGPSQPFIPGMPGIPGKPGSPDSPLGPTIGEPLPGKPLGPGSREKLFCLLLFFVLIFFSFLSKSLSKTLHFPMYYSPN